MKERVEGGVWRESSGLVCRGGIFIFYDILEVDEGVSFFGG